MSYSQGLIKNPALEATGAILFLIQHTAPSGNGILTVSGDDVQKQDIASANLATQNNGA